ncbi:MAG: NADH-quinone oxidoreductase subunit J [Chloroflexota bacterium]|nr:NADH-quinone oxidoreductase subunit J [Chloroflexota bacterium]
MADNLETTVAFWYLAIAAVGAGVLMLASRNPVHAAISLVIVIFHVAGLFVILGAGFLAVAQIAIYAGAIVVLFLFTLMMLDMRRLPEERVTHRQIWLGIPLGILLAIEAVVVSVGTPEISESIKGAFPPATVSELGGSTQALAVALFNEFTLPFLGASVLLTAATIGAIVLARRIEVHEQADYPQARPGSSDEAAADQSSAAAPVLEESAR